MKTVVEGWMSRLVAPTRSVCAAVLLLSCALGSLHAEERRKRIAVLNFEMGATDNQTATNLGLHDDMGLVLSNLLVHELVSSGKVTLVERSAVDKILQEQNLSNSDRFDNATAARIGKLVGVDAIVLGSVAQFTGTSKETTGSKIVAFGINSGAHRMQVRVSLVITAHLVDVNTGQVLASAEGHGTAQSTEMLLATGAQSSTSGSPVLDEATLKAIKMVADQLEGSPTLTAPVPMNRTEYTANVADATGNTLILDLGTKGGVKVGDMVEISRPGRVIRSNTGAVLKVLSDQLGTAKVTEVEENSATATFTGDKPAQVNDIASFKP